MKTAHLIIAALLLPGAVHAQSATAKAADGMPLMVGRHVEATVTREASARATVPLSGLTVAQLKYSNGFSGIGQPGPRVLSGQTVAQIKLAQLRQ